LAEAVALSLVEAVAVATEDGLAAVVGVGVDVDAGVGAAAVATLGAAEGVAAAGEQPARARTRIVAGTANERFKAWPPVAR